MRYSIAFATALVAGAQAGQYYAPAKNETSTSETPVYTTEVHTSLTVVCPSPTSVVYNQKTYTVSEATTLTITDCPCTVTKPVSIPPPVSATPVVLPPPVTSNGVVVPVTTPAAPAPSAPAAPAPGSPAPVPAPAPVPSGAPVPASNGTTPVAPAPSAPSAPAATYTGAASKAFAASGAGLAGVAGLLAYFL